MPQEWAEVLGAVWAIITFQGLLTQAVDCFLRVAVCAQIVAHALRLVKQAAHQLYVAKVRADKRRAKARRDRFLATHERRSVVNLKTMTYRYVWVKK